MGVKDVALLRTDAMIRTSLLLLAIVVARTAGVDYANVKNSCLASVSELFNDGIQKQFCGKVSIRGVVRVQLICKQHFAPPNGSAVFHWCSYS